MVKIFTMTFVRGGVPKVITTSINRAILPLLLLVPFVVKAEERELRNIPSQYSPSQNCPIREHTPNEKRIYKGIESLLAELDLFITRDGSDNEKNLGQQYIHRARNAMNFPVDHIHGRCWNRDYLSCSMLLSSLHEINSFLNSWHRSSSATWFQPVVMKAESQALTLREFCKSQPWKFG